MQIGDLLKRYALLIPRERTIKDALVHSLREGAGIALDPSLITVQETSILLHTTPLTKRRIKLHQAEVEKYFKEATRGLSLPDLR